MFTEKFVQTHLESTITIDLSIKKLGNNS